MRQLPADTLWETTLGQLELQVTRPNFETWLRNTVGLRIEEGVLVVGVPSDFALEWLKSRMSGTISRTLDRIAGDAMPISFEVSGAMQPAPAHGGDNGSSRRLAPSTLDPNPRMTFASFVTVDTNRLAHRATQRLLAGDASCNPLVLHGGSGIGKSHLLHATGRAAMDAGKRAVLITGEQFVNHYGQTVRAGRPHTFRDAYLECDALLLDDLGFLASRAGSQEQFFHLFNTLHAANCLIVLTAGSHPDRLPGLSAHLRSRLLAGLTVELTLPPPSERLAILQAKAADLSHPLSDSILEMVAGQPYETIRDFEGALNRVSAFAELQRGQLTEEAARTALFPFSQPAPTVDAIFAAVCSHFGLSRSQLSGASRARDVSYARHIAIYLLREYCQRALSEIGRLLGNRDHATILHGYKRIAQELNTLAETRDDISRIESALRLSSGS